MRAPAIALILCTSLAAEIVDRIAVTAGTAVITESAILKQIRLAALFDNREPDFSAAARREAAEKLVMQTLLLREMDDTRYPEPALNDVIAHAKEYAAERKLDDNGWRAELSLRKVSEDEALKFLQLMMRSMDFITLRFGRGAQITSEEIAAYFEKTYLPAWRKRNAGKPGPLLDDVADEIEQMLVEERTSQASDEWLRQTREATKIRYREEVFQ